MTVYVTAIRPAASRIHEHITEIRWLDSSTSTSNVMSVAQAVEWIRKGHGLRVAGTDSYADVRVVEANPPYIRTAADGQYTDNLLALPRY